ADGLHQMRITARRLRSCLAACRPLLDERTARRLESELRWLGQELSEIRDLEVMRERLLAAVAAEPASATTRRMATVVRSSLRKAERLAQRRSQAALNSDRHARLRAALEALLDEPPFTPRARKKAVKVLDHRLTRSWRRLTTRVAAADESSGSAHDEALHAVRKASKRLRYAAELTEPTLGKPADRLRKRAQAMQKALGDHQDSIVARAWYERLGREATSTAAAFGFGRLHAREQSAAGTYVAAYGEAVDKVRTVSRLR
ncbi:MAG: CHAD domain-containing protein, partial [Actinomycetota bacterium]|nr:CHAD domain-containing protein [Actinomycetota bacterium]